MKRYIGLLVTISSLLYCAVPNELQKIFNHRIAVTDADIHRDIELGKIVLYFTQEPIIKKTVSSDPHTGLQEVHYFIPHGYANTDEAKKMMSHLNASPSSYYKIAIQEQKTPPGIQLSISFNPSKIKIEHDTFEAITKAKAIEFHMYNKSLLDALEKKGSTVLRTAYIRPVHIIIDCGHGGTDTGAIGVSNAIEKEITLAVGKELHKELTKHNMNVLLTRADDRFVALDERTYMANQCQDAILISLHANSCPKKTARGLETFYVDRALFTKHNDLRTALDVIIDEKDDLHYTHSKKLADSVHRALLQTFLQHDYFLPDRKVKRSVPQVLLGSKWPGILVEMEFVTNPDAVALLKQPKIWALGICNGVQNYVKALQKS